MLTISNGENQIDISEKIQAAAELFIGEKEGFYNGIYETFDSSQVAHVISQAVLNFLENLDVEAFSSLNQRSPLAWEIGKALAKVSPIETGEVIDFAEYQDRIAA